MQQSRRAALHPPALCNTLRILLLAVVFAFGSSDARAEVAFVGTTIEMDRWTFLPAADHDNERVEAFLAVKTGEELVGENIAVVLYVRHADGSWERLAWTDQNDAAAVVSAAKEAAPAVDGPTVKTLLEGVGIELPSDTQPLDVGDSPGDPFGDGVLLADPMHSLIESDPSGDELVGLLVSLGYPAANVDIHVSELGFDGQTVAIEVVLDSFAATLEHGIKYPGSTTQERLDAGATTHAGSNICWPNTTISNTSAWSAWSCNGWIQIGEATQRPSSQQLWRFKYKQYASRSRTRTITRVCFDCTATSIDQQQHEQGVQDGYCDVVSTSGTRPPRSAAPAFPCSAGSNTCNPHIDITFNWTPPRPGC